MRRTLERRLGSAARVGCSVGEVLEAGADDADARRGVNTCSVSHSAPCVSRGTKAMSAVPPSYGALGGASRAAVAGATASCGATSLSSPLLIREERLGSRLGSVPAAYAEHGT